MHVQIHTHFLSPSLSRIGSGQGLRRLFAAFACWLLGGWVDGWMSGWVGG